MRLTLSILILFLALALTCFGQLQKVTYTYDDAGRLTAVDYGNGKSITYTYDQAGNLLKRLVTSAPPANQDTAKQAGAKTPPARREDGGARSRPN
jgi:YD repeat-containing protein